MIRRGLRLAGERNLAVRSHVPRFGLGALRRARGGPLERGVRAPAPLDVLVDLLHPVGVVARARGLGVGRLGRVHAHLVGVGLGRLGAGGRAAGAQSLSSLSSTGSGHRGGAGRCLRASPAEDHALAAAAAAAAAARARRRAAAARSAACAPAARRAAGLARGESESVGAAARGRPQRCSQPASRPSRPRRRTRWRAGPTTNPPARDARRAARVHGSRS